MPSTRRRPLISVIIPTCDRPQMLNAALESVAAQEFDGAVEAIVVNDGEVSVDSVVAAHANEMAVRFVESGRHLGPAVARNAGLEHASGDYIAFLDDDDLFLPGHLAAGCEVLDRDEADVVYLGAVVAERRLSGRPVDLAGYLLKAYPYDYRFLLVANYVHTGSVIVRNFADAPIRFDESLIACEDWDMWISLATLFQQRVHFVDKITCIYHQIPDVRGVVVDAQETSPTKFSLARDAIHEKWPSTDPLVLEHRRWLLSFEQYRSDLVAEYHRMPNLLFDEVLGYLHDRIRRERSADYRDIVRFFDSQAARR